MRRGLTGEERLAAAIEQTTNTAYKALSPKAWQSSSGRIHVCRKARAMSEQPNDQDRPCLHCMMVELIDEFFVEHPALGGEPDTIDTDEVLTAIAKTVAELTCSQDG